MGDKLQSDVIASSTPEQLQRRRDFAAYLERFANEEHCHKFEYRALIDQITPDRRGHSYFVRSIEELRRVMPLEASLCPFLALADLTGSGCGTVGCLAGHFYAFSQPGYDLFAAYEITEEFNAAKRMMMQELGYDAEQIMLLTEPPGFIVVPDRKGYSPLPALRFLIEYLRGPADAFLSRYWLYELYSWDEDEIAIQEEDRRQHPEEEPQEITRDEHHTATTATS